MCKHQQNTHTKKKNGFNCRCIFLQAIQTVARHLRSKESASLLQNAWMQFIYFSLVVLIVDADFCFDTSELVFPTQCSILNLPSSTSAHEERNSHTHTKTPTESKQCVGMHTQPEREKLKK